MPSRVIVGGINSSSSLASVSMLADLTFRALIVAVDDYGRTDGRLAMLKSLLFPLRDDVTTRQVEGWLRELCDLEDPPVYIYEVDGKPFIQLTNWEKHRGKSKRGGHSRWPSPNDGKIISRGSPRIPADPLGSPSEESGNRGVGESGSRGRTKTPPAPRSARPPRSPSKTSCPESLDPEARSRILIWATTNGIEHTKLGPAWEALRDWAIANGKSMADWEATFRNALRKGWVFESRSPSGERESPALAKERRQREHMREALRRSLQSDDPPTLLALDGGRQ